MSDIDNYQRLVVERLRPLLNGADVVCEWRTMTGEDGVYSPRLDLAVGPFATGHEMYGEHYDRLALQLAPFIEALYQRSQENFARFDRNNGPASLDAVISRNYNARCFIAVEIENKSSRKHLMGGAINAAALGRIGIAIGWNDEMVKAFVKLRAYLIFLSRVGKNTFDPYNLLVLGRDQFTGAIEALERHVAEGAGRGFG